VLCYDAALAPGQPDLGDVEAVLVRLALPQLAGGPVEAAAGAAGRPAAAGDAAAGAAAAPAAGGAQGAVNGTAPGAAASEQRQAPWFLERVQVGVSDRGGMVWGGLPKPSATSVWTGRGAFQNVRSIA
jgi:hypothetical protein